MKIELTKAEISYFRVHLVGEIDSFKRSVEMNKRIIALDSLNSNFYQQEIERNERFINKYSLTLDKINKALKELENERS